MTIPTTTRTGGILRLTRPVRPLIANRSHGRRFIVTKEIKDWRTWAADQTADQEPIVWPVRIDVAHLRPNRSAMPDTGACLWAAKAVIDGLVDSGVLPEDGPTVVQQLTFHAPEVVGWHGMSLTVTPI